VSVRRRIAPHRFARRKGVIVIKGPLSADRLSRTILFQADKGLRYSYRR
jgi:hypothetical protein